MQRLEHDLRRLPVPHPARPLALRSGARRAGRARRSRAAPARSARARARRRCRATGATPRSAPCASGASGSPRSARGTPRAPSTRRSVPRASTSRRRPRDTRRSARRARCGGCARRSRSSRAARSRAAAPSQTSAAVPVREPRGVALSLRHAAADLCEADGRERASARSYSSSCRRLHVESSRSAAAARAASSSELSARGYDVLGVDPAAPAGERFLQLTFQEASNRLYQERGMPSSPVVCSHHVSPLDEGIELLASLAPLLLVDEFAWDRIDAPHRTGTRASTGCCGRREPTRTGLATSTSGESAIPISTRTRRASRRAARPLRRAHARVGAVLPPLARRPVE